VALFDRVAHTVPLPGFEQRMLATKAVWLDGVLNDERAARATLSTVNPHTATDHCLLEAYLCIMPIKDPFERIQISDRALSETVDPLSRAWNLTSKAVQLVIAGDPSGAERVIDEAVQAIGPREVAGVEPVERLTIARAYGIRWKLKGSENDYASAMEWFGSIELSEFTASGQAELHHQIGTLQGDHGDLETAIGHLKVAMSLDRNTLVAVRLFDLHVQAGQRDAALQLADDLREASMSPGVRVELLAARAALAVHDHDEIELRRCIADLKAIEVSEPYFSGVRYRVCVQLLTVLDAEARNWRLPENSGMLIRLLRGLAKLCEYLELKPNVCGLGLNLNRAIEDLEKTAGRHQVQPPQRPGLPPGR
jgi:hypothetical protein